MTEIRVPDAFPDPGDVAGLRVVVTGASRGLGLLVATAFLRRGARVVLVSRNKMRLEGAQRSLGPDALIHAADVADPEANQQVARMALERWGGLDVWIANAGISPMVTDAVTLNLATWREVIDVNLNGVLYGARAAVTAMHDGGSIIVTGSVLGARPRRGLSAYAASKAAAVSLVQGLALELAERHIRVNAVAPGWFDSPLADGWRRRPELANEILGHTAMERWGASEELPGVYIFLASKAASFITGSVLVVDGGYLLA